MTRDSISSESVAKDKCEVLRQESMHKYSRVAYLAYAMESMGCNMEQLQYAIRKCESRSLGGFELDEDGRPTIVLCQNHIRDRSDMDRTLAHEMIHAYDHCRAKLNWNDAQHIACTEIRAAALSGDCDFKQEVFRKQFNIVGQHKICTRRRAKLSVSMAPHLKGKEDSSVDSIFDTCYRDTSPYREIP